jgi:hypothetical protein
VLHSSEKITGMQQGKVRAKGYGQDRRKTEEALSCVLVTCIVQLGRNYITDPTTVFHCIAITKWYDQGNAMETTGYKNIIHTLSRTYKAD